MKPDVLEELFKQHYNETLLYILSISKNHMVAEDIISEAFFIALKTEDHEIMNFKPWLLKVSKNLYLNSIRKSTRVSELTEDVKDEKELMIDSIIREDKYRELHHAISLLTPQYKEVILLFYFEDLSIKEIAFVLDKNEAIIKVTLFRAREALKKIIENKK